MTEPDDDYKPGEPCPQCEEPLDAADIVSGICTACQCELYITDEEE